MNVRVCSCVDGVVYPIGNHCTRSDRVHSCLTGAMLRVGWLSLQFLGVFGFSIIPPLGTCQRQCLYLLSVCVEFLVLLTVVTH